MFIKRHKIASAVAVPAVRHLASAISGIRGTRIAMIGAIFCSPA
jgi:hypothetical protein